MTGNVFCPFVNGGCRADCVFIEYVPGLTMNVPRCSLADRIKACDPYNGQKIFELLKKAEHQADR